MPEITETLYTADPLEWREWLQKYYDKKSEVWLVFPKASSGLPRISYNDAVEQALCFGWIDSIQKPLDTNNSVQRFTPRKNHAYFSQPNIERLKFLAENKLIILSVLKSVRPWLEKEFNFPDDIMKSLQKNPGAYNFYKTCSPSYQRIRVAYIDGARDRPEEFKKRLSNFIKSCEHGKKIMGHGGVEKYY